MAIQHTATIESVSVLNSGDQDVVSKVLVRFESFDDSESDQTRREVLKRLIFKQMAEHLPQMDGLHMQI